MDRSGDNLHYWPAYSNIPPTSRAAYLDWLSDGRRDPDTDIGYVFLFFYGIERRILIDSQHSSVAKKEVPFLLEEVERLLNIYGDYERNRSFRHYASSLLDLADLFRGSDVGKVLINTDELKPPTQAVNGRMPLRLRLALSAISKSGEPLPAEWALSWLRCTPYVSLRTPARRCAQEFNVLFQRRYQETHGNGIRVFSEDSSFTIDYKAASPSFAGEVKLSLPGFPDVVHLQSPINELSDLADKVCEELDAYSRWVRRHEDRTSTAALSLLPQSLRKKKLEQDSIAAENLDALLLPIEKDLEEQAVATIPSTQLSECFRNKKTLTKKEAGMLAVLLAECGYGIGPDVRYGEPNLSRSEYAVVFHLRGTDETPSEAYHSATILLRLGVMVATADEVVTSEEEEKLEQHLEVALELSESDRARLRAHLQWLLADPPSARGLKSQIKNLQLSEKTCREIGQFLITVAGADGHISAVELKKLARIYPLLGLEADSVYTDVHSMATPGPAPNLGPVTVLPARERKSFKIPEPDSSGSSGAVALDMAKVATIRERSLQAAEVLKNVFVEEEKPELIQYHSKSDNQYTSDTLSPVAGLDTKHSALLRALSERSHWSRSEYQGLVNQHDLLPDGALEIINEAAFEICGEPVLEGNDEIEVNLFAINEVLS